jgi:16S rRNA (cytidine1402-2'-O)-methyltransferase
MSKVYVVGPWPQDVRDAPLRMVRILGQVSLVVARDAALAQRALSACGVQTPFRQARTDPADEAAAIGRNLESGDVAWLFERLADLQGPAAQLLQALGAAGVELLPVPGPSATLSALAVSGLPATRFTWLERLPVRSEARRARLREVAGERETLIAEVAGEDLPALLADVEAVLGERPLAVYGAGRVWRGSTAQAPPEEKGAVTLVIAGAAEEVVWSEDAVRERAQALLEAGRSVRDAAREVAARSGWPRKRVYRLLIDNE